MSAPALIAPQQPPPGYVSDTCRFVDDADQRMIFVNGMQFFWYRPDDRRAARQAWTLVYEGKWATYNQIAAATGISRRSLQNWVKRYREQGVAGLDDLPGSGRPRKVTDLLRKKICRLRERRLKLHEIAQACQLSKSSVVQVLKEQRLAAEAAQGELDLPQGPQETVQSGAEADADDDQDAATEAQGELAIDEADADDDQAPSTEAESQSAVAPAAELSDDAPAAWDDNIEAAMAVDRQDDRNRAAAGELQDAEPLFAPGENLAFAGVFLAIVVLATDPLLKVADRIYGQFESAFYGVRTALTTLVSMLLLRIKRPEQLRRHNPRKLGRVLGLDRIMEVKTLRRILLRFGKRGKAATFMNDLAAARSQAQDGPISTAMVDGHMRVYHGVKKVAESHSARCSKVVKGQTDNWVHLPGGLPLLAVGSDFHQSLSQVLPAIAAQVKEITGQESVNLCFDRGGSCAWTFEQVVALGCHVLTYRTGPFDPVPIKLFRRETTIIGGREYAFAPYETEVTLPVYETVDRGPQHKLLRRETGRTVKLRDIRILREDGGQTSILASLPAKQLSAVAAAETIFDRIGSQENTFKYMRAEFDLDALICYGVEELDESLTHPNPVYVKLEKKAKSLRDKRNRIYGKYGVELAGLTGEAAVARLNEVYRGLHSGDADAADAVKDSKSKRRRTALERLRADANALAKLNRELADTAATMATTAPREQASAGGYKRLRSELSVFMNAIKMSVYQIESELVDLLEKHYPRAADEGRSVVAAALRSSGSVRLEPGRLVVQLEAQSEPRRTRAVNALAAELTRRTVCFPGSSRVIVFEPTAVPPPPPATAK